MVKITYPKVKDVEQEIKFIRQIEKIRRYLFDITKNAVYTHYVAKKESNLSLGKRTVYFKNNTDFSFFGHYSKSFLVITQWPDLMYCLNVNIIRGKSDPELEKDEQLHALLSEIDKEVNIIVTYKN